MRFGFDNTFKNDNIILSLVSRLNGMIGWMVRNFISRETNLVLKLQVFISNIVFRPKLGGLTRKRDKNNFKKEVKYYTYKERLEKLGLTTKIENEK